MRHERHIQKCHRRRHDSPHSPCRLSNRKSQVRTTETILAHVVYRQSYHDRKTPVPLLSSLTSSIPQQHGMAQYAASKSRRCIRRITSQPLAHDTPFARRNICFSASSNADYQYERARCYRPYLCLAKTLKWTLNETATALLFERLARRKPLVPRLNAQCTTATVGQCWTGIGIGGSVGAGAGHAKIIRTPALQRRKNEWKFVPLSPAHNSSAAVTSIARISNAKEVVRMMSSLQSKLPTLASSIVASLRL